MSQDDSTSQRGTKDQEIVPIPDGVDPATNWLPLCYRRTPYDEDEIVHLITEIFRNFIRLSDVNENEIVWPLPGGHEINEVLCDELNISDTARSLIRRLPIPNEKTSAAIVLFDDSRLFRVTDDENLRWSRAVPAGTKGSVLPQDVQLSAGDRDSRNIFLDTKENTIRVAGGWNGPMEENPPDTPLEYPEDEGHYRNFWPQHAPTWLRIHLNKIKALDRIPCAVYGNYIDFETEWLRRKVKHILEGTYGWPDDFQQAAWNEDQEQIWDDVVEEFDRLGNPMVLNFH